MAKLDIALNALGEITATKEIAVLREEFKEKIGAERILLMKYVVIGLVIALIGIGLVGIFRRVTSLSRAESKQKRCLREIRQVDAWWRRDPKRARRRARSVIKRLEKPSASAREIADARDLLHP